MRFYGPFLLLLAFLAACNGGPTDPTTTEDSAKWYLEVKSTQFHTVGAAGRDVTTLESLANGSTFAAIMRDGESVYVGSYLGTGTFPGETVGFVTQMISPRGERVTYVRSSSTKKPYQVLLEGGPFSYQYSFAEEALDEVVEVAFLYRITCKEEGEFIISSSKAVLIVESRPFEFPFPSTTVSCTRIE